MVKACRGAKESTNDGTCVNAMNSTNILIDASMTMGNNGNNKRVGGQASELVVN